MAKGIMIIDGICVPFDGEKNVLAVVRKAGIDIPTFCYYSDLSVYGACRMCMVEDTKTGKIEASCSMEPGTACPSALTLRGFLKHRRMILELLLASHDCNCTNCAKSGNCRLQELAQRFGVRHIRFPDTRPAMRWTTPATPSSVTPTSASSAAIASGSARRSRARASWTLPAGGSELQVMPAFDKKLSETKCVSCGQCAAVCTTGAITVNDQIGTAWKAIHDPPKAGGGADRPCRPGGHRRGIWLRPR